MSLSVEERAILTSARQIKARQRKEAKKAHPRQVQPQRSDKAEGALRERRPRVRDKTYLAWIRNLPCLGCSRRGEPTRFGARKRDAAHIRCGYPEPGWTYTGAGEKPSDWRTVGFCRACHDEERDRRSESDFWAIVLDLYPPAVCERLRAAYEAGEDGAAVIVEIARWEGDRP